MHSKKATQNELLFFLPDLQDASRSTLITWT